MTIEVGDWVRYHKVGEKGYRLGVVRSLDEKTILLTNGRYVYRQAVCMDKEWTRRDDIALAILVAWASTPVGLTREEMVRQAYEFADIILERRKTE